MARFRVRSSDNSRWIDICQSEFYIRDPSNTQWVRLIPGKLAIRHGTNNYWLNVNCMTEEECDEDVYGGTVDGKGTNGSGPGVIDPTDPNNIDGPDNTNSGGTIRPVDPNTGLPIDPNNSGNTGGGNTGGGNTGGTDGGGIGGGTATTRNIGSSTSPSNNLNPAGGGNTGNNSAPSSTNVNPRWNDPDAGSSTEGGGDTNSPNGTYTPRRRYPPGYDLPDGAGTTSGQRTTETGTTCIVRDGLGGICESNQTGIRESTCDGEGTFEDPKPCPCTVYGIPDTEIIEYYIKIANTVTGHMNFDYGVNAGRISVDVYYYGQRQCTTNGKVSVGGNLSFLFDAGVGQGEDILFVRVRQDPDSDWQLSWTCPESDVDDNLGTPTNPAACHGTFAPAHGGGAGVHEFVHDMGSDPGEVVIDYQMWNIADKMELFYHGGKVASTNAFVSGEGSLSFNYQPVGNDTLVTVRITSVNTNTAWVYQINCPDSQGSSVNPMNCGVDGIVHSGGAGITDTYFNLGAVSGAAVVRYQMYNIMDQLDVFQGGNLIATTGGPVAGENYLPFEYNAAAGEVLVRVTGSGRTSWSFLVECPLADIPCGQTFSGQTSANTKVLLTGITNGYSLVEWASIASGYAPPAGVPDEVQVKYNGNTAYISGDLKFRYEDYGYGTVVVPTVLNANDLTVAVLNSNSYWRHTTYCPVVYAPSFGMTKFITGIPRAYEFGFKFRAARSISCTASSLAPANSAQIAMTMFNTTSGQLSISGFADDYAYAYIVSSTGSITEVGQFNMSQVLTYPATVSPGIYFLFVVVENVPDNTPSHVALDILDVVSGKYVCASCDDWHMDFFEPSRAYGLGNTAIFTEIEEKIYDDDAAALAATSSMGAPPSIQDIFNTWARYNGIDYYTSGAASSGDAAAWTFASSPDRFIQPRNVGHPNAILSAASYSNYTIEATLTSENNDNDTIGMVAAFAQVGVDNLSLVVARSKGGFPPSNGFGILFITNSTVVAINNVSQGGAVGGWSGDKTRIVITRNRDIIKYKSSNWNDLTTFGPEYTLDLNSDARFAPFLTSARVGFFTQSQAGSTYLDVLMPGLGSTTIRSVSTGKTWTYDGANWISTVAPFSNDLGAFVRATNTDTNKKYLIYKMVQRAE